MWVQSKKQKVQLLFLPSLADKIGSSHVIKFVPKKIKTCFETFDFDVLITIETVCFKGKHIYNEV